MGKAEVVFGLNFFNSPYMWIVSFHLRGKQLLLLLFLIGEESFRKVLKGGGFPGTFFGYEVDVK